MTDNYYQRVIDPLLRELIFPFYGDQFIYILGLDN